MKDRLLLVLTGIVCALGAWQFWRYLGDDALTAFSTLVLILTGVDNFRLRRELRKLRKEGGAGRPASAASATDGQ